MTALESEDAAALRTDTGVRPTNTYGSNQVSSIVARSHRLAERARRLPPYAVDAGIAVICVFYTLIQVGIDGNMAWWVPLTAMVNALPLLWRRKYPFAVTPVIGASTTVLAAVDALGDLPAAQLVATYTFAALCPPLKRMIAVVGTVFGISLSIILPDEGALNIGPATIVFAVAYAFGTASRARRDRIEMLEERARRLAEQHDAAAARERQRIAREMHDILAHSMSLVVVQAEAGPVAVRRDPEKAEEMFDAISATAREALTQLRRALGVLRSDEADREPAPDLAAVPGLLDHVRESGLVATLEEHGQRRTVPPDLAATVYRIVQESLTNTVKHAAASTVAVALTWRRDALYVEVSDDGRGAAAVPADRNGTPGHGLVGMRERVAAAGGELTAGPSSNSGGFHIEARLPLQ